MILFISRVILSPMELYLEKLFDQNDVAKYSKVQPNEDDIQDHNIGTEEHPRIKNVSKKFPANDKEKYLV